MDTAERRFDRQFGTETRSGRSCSVDDAPERSRWGGYPYEATTSGAIRLIVRSATKRPGDWTFVDIGSGKAKVLMLAAELGFRKAFGVEHSPSLARVAESNISAYRQRRPDAPPIRSVAADATAIELPAGPLVVYLYNPFGEVLVRAFARNIRRSLEASPRPLVLAYLNPLHSGVLEEECTFLERTGVLETLLQQTCYVYRSAQGAAPSCRND